MCVSYLLVLLLLPVPPVGYEGSGFAYKQKSSISSVQLQNVSFPEAKLHVKSKREQRDLHFEQAGRAFPEHLEDIWRKRQSCDKITVLEPRRLVVLLLVLTRQLLMFTLFHQLRLAMLSKWHMKALSVLTPGEGIDPRATVIFLSHLWAKVTALVPQILHV